MTELPSGSASLDLILVGGGLANGLIALRLQERRPELRLRLIEQNTTLGGHHTWSFHQNDISDAQRAWLKPLIGGAWPRHKVAFPGYQRVLDSGYYSIRSGDFHRVLCQRLAGKLSLGRGVVRMDSREAVLDDGSRLSARCLIDGRGFPEKSGLALGYQKFHGLELRLKSPHGLTEPVLMDARVPQTGGYRFFYLLPWTERDLLVEETIYADTPDWPEPAERGVLDYAAGRGWQVDRVLHEEHGVLPIPLQGSIEDLLPDGPVVGTRAGLFHATTSYSLPWALRLADELADLPSLEAEPVERLLRQRAEQHWREGRFFRALNRMLFQAARPEGRIRVFERFYRLSSGLIERFYAGRLRWTDQARILAGRPPVPVLRALRSVLRSTSR